MYDANFLDLDPVVRDTSGLGLPVIRITFQQYENELKIIRFVRERSKELLRQMGVEKIWTGPELTGVGSSHDLGGLRMGTDEAASVVNADLMTHEVPEPLCDERRGVSVGAGDQPDADHPGGVMARGRQARRGMAPRSRDLNGRQ